MRRFAAHRDPEDRAWLVDRYLPLARHVAARYRGGSEPIEDLEQVASLGLVKAIDRFDAGRGTSFSSYAVPTISGELRRHFRDYTWSLRVPRDLQERAIKVGKTESALTLELGRAPTAAELADRLDCTVEELLEARDAAGANRMSSLDAPVGGEEDDGGSLAELLGADDTRLEELERELTVDSALASLDDALAHDPAAALQRGAHAGRDRRARRALPDARLAADPPGARDAPRRGAARPGDGLREAA